MKRTAQIAILGMGVFLAIPAHADVPASKLGIYGYNHDLATDATGVVHMIWKQAGWSAVNYGRLVNGSVQTVDTIPGSGNINDVRSKPRLSVRADGTSVHTAWCTPDYTELHHAWRDGGGWQTERVWASAGSTDRCAEPVVGAAPDGTLHLIFQMWDNPGQLPSRLTYYRRPAVGAWQEIGVISPSKKNPEYRDTAIFVDKDGGAHLGFTTMYRYVSPQGVLGPEEQLPFRAGASGSCCGDLFVDAAGAVHYPQADWPLDTVDYTYKPKSGDWIVPEQVSETPCSSGNYGYEKWPAVTVGADGKVYITWAMPDCAAKTTPYVHLAVRDQGGAWTQVMLDSDADIHARGKISMTASGALVHTIWRDANGELVLYTIDTGAGLPDGGTPDAGGGDAGSCTQCTDGCYDLNLDHDHCGKCDKKCLADEICYQRTCMYPSEIDASIPDAALTDGGAADGSQQGDAGTLADAGGAVDAGTPDDAGVANDAGRAPPSDAGKSSADAGEGDYGFGCGCSTIQM